MFDLLGLQAKSDLLTIGDISALVHPSDLDLKKFVEEVNNASAAFVERLFRIRHARRGWLSVKARFELITEPIDSSVHLLGIVVEQSDEKYPADEMVKERQLVEALDDIPVAMAMWNTNYDLLFCNAVFQKLHDISDKRMLSGVRYEDAFGHEAEKFKWSKSFHYLSSLVVRSEDRRLIDVDQSFFSFGSISIETDVTAHINRANESAVLKRMSSDGVLSEGAHDAVLADNFATASQKEQSSQGAVYWRALVRLFEVGIILSAFGLACCIFGYFGDHFLVQLFGAGILALGSTITAMSVIAGQDEDESLFHDKPI